MQPRWRLRLATSFAITTLSPSSLLCHRLRPCCLVVPLASRSRPRFAQSLYSPRLVVAAISISLPPPSARHHHPSPCRHLHPPVMSASSSRPRCGRTQIAPSRRIAYGAPVVNLSLSWRRQETKHDRLSRAAVSRVCLEHLSRAPISNASQACWSVVRRCATLFLGGVSSVFSSISA